MTDRRERATPTTKRNTHADRRALRSVDDAMEQAAPVQMPGHSPFPLGGQRFPGRGAGAQRAADVLARQRTLGNRATGRLLQRHAAPTAVPALIQRELASKQQYRNMKAYAVEPGNHGMLSVKNYGKLVKTYKRQKKNKQWPKAYATLKIIEGRLKELNGRQLSFPEKKGYWINQDLKKRYFEPIRANLEKELAFVSRRLSKNEPIVSPGGQRGERWRSQEAIRKQVRVHIEGGSLLIPKFGTEKPVPISTSRGAWNFVMTREYQFYAAPKNDPILTHVSNISAMATFTSSAGKLETIAAATIRDLHLIVRELDSGGVQLTGVPARDVATLRVYLADKLAQWDGRNQVVLSNALKDKKLGMVSF